MLERKNKNWNAEIYQGTNSSNKSKYFFLTFKVKIILKPMKQEKNSN